MTRPTVLLDLAATDEQIANQPEVLSETCPKCGSQLAGGFGLLGGGYGPYVYCETEGCGFFEKQFLANDEA